MKNILLLDTSIASANKGDDIIMECCREEMAPILRDSFELTLPTHVSAFHWYQVLRKSNAYNRYAKCDAKFVCGTNLLVPHLLTHYPQWNINIFNYQALKGCVLVGVGVGAGAEGSIERYTKYIYRHLLNDTIYHSVRDARAKAYLERLGIKSINTGCVTMWMLTPEHCAMIPHKKAEQVIFTLTASDIVHNEYQILIDTLLENYKEVYYWPQGIDDYDYLHQFRHIKGIKILQATLSAYRNYLSTHDTDYVGTRLHGGVYAMRNKRRSIIIAIDERARAINYDTNINCIEMGDIINLDSLIRSDIATSIQMPFDEIARWKSQFVEFCI